MNGNDEPIGPIDYMIVEWPSDTVPSGEVFPHLVDLVDRGLIRVIDLSFVRKDEDGTVTRLALEDFPLGDNPDLALFVGASSGILDDEDHMEAAKALDPGSIGAILVHENLWAAPFGTALRKSGAQLVAFGRVPTNAVIATLDALDAAEA